MIKWIASKYFLYSFLFLVIVRLLSGANSEFKIGFISSFDAGEKESIAAHDFFVKKYAKSEVLNFSDIKNNSSSLTDIKVLWFHRPDSSNFAAVETDPKVITTIKNYLQNGGNLLLTLDAFRYLKPLGLETVEPQVRYVIAADQGYGRNLGLHAFRSHPVFDGLHGGAYIFNPVTDYKCRQIGYFGSSVPENGKVVAVDWAYITLKEDSKLMLEYKVGKGRVLAIGAYTFFQPENKNRMHLEKFIENCMNYLAGNSRDQQKQYWNYETAVIVPFDEPVLNTDKITLKEAESWSREDNPMTLKSRFASDNAWDVAGRQIVLMGEEKGGITEAWAHPFMAFRDYEVGIQFSYKDTVYWLNNERPSIEVLPESFTRTYKFRRAYLTEIISVGMNDPIVIVHYEYRGVYPAKLIIKYKTNFRFMWPYSDKVLGSLYYRWDDQLNAFYVTTKDTSFALIQGASKIPELKLSGRYSDFEKADQSFIGNPTNTFSASFLEQFNLKMNDNLNIVFSASSTGFINAEENYTKTIENPYEIFKETCNSTDDFLKQTLMIETPDPDFNQGYRWAVAGTDRFFVNTPGLGTALVAGYATTAKGWDGGHVVNGRPGYAWYFGRDAEWSSFAVLDYGDFESVRKQLEFFNRFQDISGKIFHELTTSGAVHYDAADATPLYIILAGKYLRHSGDTDFITNTWSHIEAALDFCFSTDSDGDHLIENTAVGHGWIEGGKLYGAHTTLYLASCWAEALEQAAYMAWIIGLGNHAAKYKAEAEIVRNIIRTKFWNRETGFFNYGLWKDGTFDSEPTVLAAIPMYFNQTDESMAGPILQKFAGNGFTTDWGVRILSAQSPLYNPRSYHGGSVWPLFTGWAALAEYRFGNAVQGFSHIMENLQIYHDWSLGYLEEVLNGSEYKPAGVCAHQCWSETMVIQPVIEGMLGFKPDAQRNKLTLAPVFPTDWDTIKISNIRMGLHQINIQILRSKNKTTYTFIKNNSGPVSIDFEPLFPAGTKFGKVLINNQKQSAITEDFAGSKKISLAFTLESEAKIEISHLSGVSVLPVITHPKPGYRSEGFRIVSSKLDGNKLTVHMQGEPGNNNILRVYAPGRSIKKLFGADLIRSNGNIHNIKVPFENQDTEFLDKTVIISFSKVK